MSYNGDPDSGRFVEPCLHSRFDEDGHCRKCGEPRHRIVLSDTNEKEVKGERHGA